MAPHCSPFWEIKVIDQLHLVHIDPQQLQKQQIILYCRMTSNPKVHIQSIALVYWKLNGFAKVDEEG